MAWYHRSLRRYEGKVVVLTTKDAQGFHGELLRAFRDHVALRHVKALGKQDGNVIESAVKGLVVVERSNISTINPVT